MTSDQQRAANQANALRSTGPKTPKGRAAVRLNAVRHGLRARHVVLPGEDAGAFEDLRNQVWDAFAPVGSIEGFLVDRLINAIWRLRRLERAETALFHWRICALKANRLAERVCSFEEPLLGGLTFTTITDKDLHAEVMEARARAEDERDRDEVLIGCAIDADAKEGDAFGKLARYETALERSLFRTLHELRQVQDERRDRAIPKILDGGPSEAEGAL